MAETVIALGGQSIPAALFTETVSVMPVPRAGTFMWHQASASWVAPTGAGAIELANMLNAQTGNDIYLINGCVGGTALLQANANPATPTQYWLSNAPDSPLTWLLSQVAACGKTPAIFMWNQGQQDCLCNVGDMFNGYLQGLLQLQGILLNAWGLSANQLKFSVSPSGLAPWGNAQPIWRAQLHIRHYAGFSLAPAYYDLPTVDGVHLTGPAYVTWADRLARNLLKQLGHSGFSNAGPGPMITSSWKSGTTVAIATDSGTGLTTYPGTSTLSGFQVWNYDYSWNIPVAAAYLSSGLIFLTLAADPGGNQIRLGYMNNQYQPTNAPVFDGQSQFVPGGSPLMPLSNECLTLN